MQISEHYLGYEEETIIVVTNNELAKLYGAKKREVEEIGILEFKTETRVERGSGQPNDGPPHFDEQKRHSRLELYKRLSDRLMELLKDEYKHVILCAPEALKNEIVEAMHTDVSKAVQEVVPKNLASLPLDQVIRILQEKKPS